MSKAIAVPLFLATPGLAILIVERYPSPGWYWAAAGAASCLLAGIFILTNRITLPRKKMSLRPLTGATSFLLLPQQTPRERLYTALFLLISIALPFLILAAQFEIATSFTLLAAHQFCAAAILLTLALIAPVALRARALDHQGDCQLTIDRAALVLDTPFTLHATITARKPLQITRWQVRLVCVEHILMHSGRYSHHVTRPHREILATLAGPTTLSAQQSLSGSATLRADSKEHPPSGQTSVATYPHYHWEIRLELTGSLNSTAIYPITLNRPAPAARTAAY